MWSWWLDCALRTDWWRAISISHCAWDVGKPVNLKSISTMAYLTWFIGFFLPYGEFDNLQEKWPLSSRLQLLLGSRTPLMSRLALSSQLLFFSFYWWPIWESWTKKPPLLSYRSGMMHHPWQWSKFGRDYLWLVPVFRLRLLRLPILLNRWGFNLVNKEDIISIFKELL